MKRHVGNAVAWGLRHTATRPCVHVLLMRVQCRLFRKEIQAVHDAFRSYGAALVARDAGGRRD